MASAAKRAKRSDGLTLGRGGAADCGSGEAEGASDGEGGVEAADGVEGVEPVDGAGGAEEAGAAAEVGGRAVGETSVEVAEEADSETDTEGGGTLGCRAGLSAGEGEALWAL